jgi:hypothetical protein
VVKFVSFGLNFLNEVQIVWLRFDALMEFFKCFCVLIVELGLLVSSFLFIFWLKSDNLILGT